MRNRQFVPRPKGRDFYLVSYFGTLLFTDEAGRLGQIAIAKVDPGTRLISLTKDEDLSCYLAFHCPPKVDPNQDQTSPFSVQLESKGQDMASIRRGEAYMCADNFGAVGFNRSVAAEWETFCLISTESLEELVRFFANDWLAITPRTDAQPFRPQPTLEGTIQCGERVYNVSQLASIKSRPEFSRVSISTGWVIDLFMLYNPLIYLVSYGTGDSLRLLELSLESLAEFGEYVGAVLVVTDRRPCDIERLCPKSLRPKLSCLNLTARQYVDYVAARYAAIGFIRDTIYQPLLYVDTDVIFDAPVAPMLRAVARSTKISAQEEPFSWLDQSPSVGSELFSESGLIPVRTKGFCSGVLGIPNIELAKSWFELVLETIYLYQKTLDRESAVDQPVLNYLSYRYDFVEVTTLTPYVRYTVPWSESSESNIEGGGKPQGIVHFWGSHGRKIADAQSYVDGLRVGAKDA